MENLKRFAQEIGLNQGDFNTCFDAGKYTGQIADEIAEAENRGVNSTPTFFVGQNPVDTDYDAISTAIEAALATPPAATPTPEATPTAEGTPRRKAPLVARTARVAKAAGAGKAVPGGRRPRGRPRRPPRTRPPWASVA